MYYILQFKDEPKGINIQGAYLYSIAERKEVVRFHAATKSGWKSYKAIRPDFEYTQYEPNESPDGLVCDALAVSDEVAEQLIAKYRGVAYRIYSPYPGDGMMQAVYQLAERGLISDPSDTSGQFSRP